MSSPGSPRPSVACPTLAPSPMPGPGPVSRTSLASAPTLAPVLLLALLPTLGGCGNRGELYLESPADVEVGLDAFGRVEPADDSGIPPDVPELDPALDPSPLPPDDAVAPTVSPEIEPTSGPDEKDERDDEDDEDDDEGAAGS